MQLLFIRHGQSQNNHRFAASGDDTGRSPDPDLTELGHRQAEALARRITDGSYPAVTHLYSSLMRRTIQTATPIADALDLPIVARLDSYEIPGPYANPFSQRVVHRGSPRSFLAGLTPRVVLPDEATEEGWFHGELEATDAPHRRAAALLDDLRATHGPDDVVALVAHGAFGGVLLGAALGTRPDVWYTHHNTGTTLIGWHEASALEDQAAAGGLGAVMLHWHNRLDHLRDDERS